MCVSVIYVSVGLVSSHPSSIAEKMNLSNLRASGEELKVRKGGQGRETLHKKVWLWQRFFVVGSGGHQYGCKGKREKM